MSEANLKSLCEAISWQIPYALNSPSRVPEWSYRAGFWYYNNCVYCNWVVENSIINGVQVDRFIVQFEIALDALTPDFNSFRFRPYSSYAGQWGNWKQINVTNIT